MEKERSDKNISKMCVFLGQKSEFWEKRFVFFNKKRENYMFFCSILFIGDEVYCKFYGTTCNFDINDRKICFFAVFLEYKIRIKQRKCN